MQQRTSAYAALAIGVFAISWSAIFVRWTHMPGIASAFYRVLFASMALAPFLLVRSADNLRMTTASLLLAILGGAFFARSRVLQQLCPPDIGEQRHLPR